MLFLEEYLYKTLSMLHSRNIPLGRLFKISTQIEKRKFYEVFKSATNFERKTEK